VRLLFIFFVVSGLVTACGMEQGFPNSGSIGGSTEVLDYTQENYPLVDVVKSSVNDQDVTRVFKAEGATIENVASQIQDNVSIEPVEVSEKIDDKQILVYDNYFVTMTVDPENSSNTLIEVANYGFVRDNYQPSFFNGLLVGWVLNEILDVDDWGKKQQNRCKYSQGGCYGGYSVTGKGYKGPVGQPSLRGGSSSVRGGGPGTGK
jgi:hypothetical protein